MLKRAFDYSALRLNIFSMGTKLLLSSFPVSTILFLILTNASGKVPCSPVALLEAVLLN